ncbi:MAG: mannitol-1-phosphate 5-dehydrogenase [Armatimonadota bacterium]
MARKAIQFGAGNIGRGFTTQLFTESGYEVVFSDVVDDVVNLINERGSYPIEIVGDNAETVIIKNVRAVNGKDQEAVAREIKDASLICTAVGVNVLKFVAPPIALGIKMRADAGIEEPINILICENLIHASDILRGYILSALPAEYEEYVRTHVGLVESVVSRMVPIMTEEQKQKDPLSVYVEAYKKLPVDKRGFIGEIPNIVGMQPYDNLEGYVERKLFTHNLAHAAAGYLGYLRGHEYVWQAVGDAVVLAKLRAALAETGEALIKKWGFTPEEHKAHIEDLLHRFANVALGDTCTRVGKDPIRKLGTNDRVVGGAKLAVSYGIKPVNVALVAAAGLVYDNTEDEAAVKIQQMISDEGLDAVFEKICGIDPKTELADLIRQGIDDIKSGKWAE